MPDNSENLSKKFNLLVENLRQNYGLSFDEILELSTTLSGKEKVSIPLEVLKNRDLGVLESTTIYLKDEKDMKFSEIAKALDRDDRTIWATYHKAKKKLGEKK